MFSCLVGLFILIKIVNTYKTISVKNIKLTVYKKRKLFYQF